MRISQRAAVEDGQPLDDRPGDEVRGLEGQPDLPAMFNLPDDDVDASLLAVARTVAKLVSDRAADFAQFGLAADLSAALLQLCTDFEEAGKTQKEGSGDITENVAEMEANVTREMEIRTQLHTMVTNAMRNDPGPRAEWEVARHIERPPRGDRRRRRSLNFSPADFHAGSGSMANL